MAHLKIVTLLCTLFNKMLAFSKVPELFRSGVIIPVPKISREILLIVRTTEELLRFLLFRKFSKCAYSICMEFFALS